MTADAGIHHTSAPEQELPLYLDGPGVSEICDHFNNIAVFSLALAVTHSGLVVSGIMLARAVPAVMAGPLAGVLLDRMLHIHLPPLRDRGEDTLLMAMVFLKQAAVTYRKPIRGYTPQAVGVLRSYSWPGNVRELSNRVRRAVVMADGMEITPHDLDLAGEEPQPVDSLDSLREAHRRIEMELLVKAISLHRGNMTRMARDLKVSRSTLYRKLRAYGLEKFVPTATPLSFGSRTKSKKSKKISPQGEWGRDIA